MATKKLIWVLSGFFVVSAWVFGSVVLGNAEILNFKSYTYGVKQEIVPVSDKEIHNLALSVRRGFYLFENGEVATVFLPQIMDFSKGEGSYTTYGTYTFADGATISTKVQGTWSGVAASAKGEIIKGTGRFEGIKGTVSIKSKNLPLEKGEVGGKIIGEGTITYTLPAK
ncbi:MAG: hypothetical protein AB1585_03860 [Thermodesulfobacteriota bacterium]